jgi:hypothetical protein
MAAAGTFTASDGTTHVQVCTSPNGTTWQATDLGQGGNTPSSGRRIAVAVTPAGETVALWGNWPCSTCTAVVEAAVHPAGGSWSAPVTLSTGLGLSESDGGLVIGTDGAGNVIAGGSWQTAAPLPSGSSGGLVVADPAGTFVYAGTTGNAFTFTSGATSFGAGSGSHSSLADLKIVPGHAVMLATDAVSTEPVT